MNLARVRKVKDISYGGGHVLYWINRDMRFADNWGLMYALLFAESKKVGVDVVYNLDPGFLGGGMRQLHLKLDILRSLEAQCRSFGLGFYVVLQDDFLSYLPEMMKELGSGVLVTDFSPLRIQKEWLHDAEKRLPYSIYQVDTHNIVPVWVASQKQEFGAYTIRPKIKRYLPEFLTGISSYPEVQKRSSPQVSWETLEKIIANARDNGKIIFPAQEHEAWNAMHEFLSNGLPTYHTMRNDPAVQMTSRLSPYLHYGVLSPQRLALEVQKADAPQEAKDAYLEELIVRRELADNFCHYNPHYDTPEGFPAWAKKTLEEHRHDPRDYSYTQKEFEEAKTHDPLWNAAQKEMLSTGRMHGYMRMYWAKKIFEWTPDVETAMDIAIALNDTYQLDGRDPNGYTGIAWSMGGVHDRAWFERPVFGKIRYMNANGCRAKFDVDTYIQKNSFLSGKEQKSG